MPAKQKKYVSQQSVGAEKQDLKSSPGDARRESKESKESKVTSSVRRRSQHSSPRRSLSSSVNSSTQHTPVERAPNVNRLSRPSSPYSTEAYGSTNANGGGCASSRAAATASSFSSSKHPARSHNHSRGSSTLSKELNESPLFMSSPPPPTLPVRENGKSMANFSPLHRSGPGVTAGASGEDMKLESLSRSSSFNWAQPSLKNSVGMDPTIQLAQRLAGAGTAGDITSLTVDKESRGVKSTGTSGEIKDGDGIPAKHGTNLSLPSGSASAGKSNSSTTIEKPEFSTPTSVPVPAKSAQLKTGTSIPSPPVGIPPAPPNLPLSLKKSVPSDACTPLNASELQAAGSIDPQICCPLQNQGNSCYFNSCVQLLANCPAFLYGLRNGAWSRSRRVCSGVQRVVKTASLSCGQQFYEAMARLFYAMEFQSVPTGHALSTEVALNSLGMVNPTFEGRSQQDAAEMLATVLGTMEEEGRTMVDVQMLALSFQEDAIRMRHALSREDSRVASEEFLEDDAKSISQATLEPVFSTSSAGGAEVAPSTSPQAQKQKAGRSSSVGGMSQGNSNSNSNALGPRSTSFYADSSSGSGGRPHWTKLLELMQRINKENEALEVTAHQREQKKREDAAVKNNSGGKTTSNNCGSGSDREANVKTTALAPLKELQPFVAPKLLFNDVTDAFTGYTVSETKCHECDNISRSMHTFQTILLDIPTTEERVKTGSWKVYGVGSHSHHRSRRNHGEDVGYTSVNSLSGKSTSPEYEAEPPRPHSTPAALRSYEAKHAERLPESPKHDRTASTSISELDRNPSSAAQAAAHAHTSNSFTPKGSARKGMWGGSVLHFFSSIKDKLFSKQLEEPRTLKECFHHHFMPFSFTGQNLYRCESCGKASEATKREYIAHLPETLLVQMKRFESGTVFHSKKMDPVVFPVSWQPISTSQSFSTLCRDEVLDLAEFIYPPLRHTYRSCKEEERDMEAMASATSGHHHKRTSSKMSSSGVPHVPMGSPHGASNSRQFHSRQSSGIPTVGSPLRAPTVPQIQGPFQPVSTYSLVGVINHHGSLGGGHYTTFALKASQNGQKMWVLLNDEEYAKVNEKEVADSEEYILMYRQQPVVERPRSNETRLQEMARYILQHNGRRPCITNGRPTGIPLSSSGNNIPGNSDVYISRSWLHRAAFLGDPGPIMNRICYCSAADQEKPIPIPGVPFHVMREQKLLPHVHLVPLEWFFVSISEEDYEAFFQFYGGNAWVSAIELQRLHEEQEKYKNMIQPLLSS